MDGPERLVLRPLAEILVAGNSLTQAQIDEVQEGLARRDTLIGDYREEIASLRKRLDAARASQQEFLKSPRVTLLGYGTQEGATRGMYTDSWVAPSFGLRVVPRRATIGVVLHGWAPKTTPSGARLRLSVNEVAVDVELRPGLFAARAELPDPSVAALEIGVEATPAADPESPDRRPRAFVLKAVELRHEA